MFCTLIPLDPPRQTLFGQGSAHRGVPLKRFEGDPAHIAYLGDRVRSVERRWPVEVRSGTNCTSADIKRSLTVLKGHKGVNA